MLLGLQLDAAVNQARASEFMSSLTEIEIVRSPRALSAMEHNVTIVGRLIQASDAARGRGRDLLMNADTCRRAGSLVRPCK